MAKDTKTHKDDVSKAAPVAAEVGGKSEPPKAEKKEPTADTPAVVEEVKDEATLLEERRRKRQELLDRLKKTDKSSTSTPTTPSASGATPSVAASPLTINPSSPLAISTPGSMGDSQPGTPTSMVEDRPFHRAVMSTKKSEGEMAILKSKDAYEPVANGTDTEHDMSAADYKESAPSLPAAVKEAPAKDPTEIDMFADFEDDMFDLGNTSENAAPSKPVVKAAVSEATTDYNPTLVDNWDDAEGYYRK